MTRSDGQVVSVDSFADGHPPGSPGPKQASIVLQIEDETGRIVTHRVRKGDTLWGISERYTGSGFNYPAVAKDNRIKNPHLIYPRQKIKVR